MAGLTRAQTVELLEALQSLRSSVVSSGLATSAVTVARIEGAVVALNAVVGGDAADVVSELASEAGPRSTAVQA